MSQEFTVDPGYLPVALSANEAHSLIPGSVTAVLKAKVKVWAVSCSCYNQMEFLLRFLAGFLLPLDSVLHRLTSSFSREDF